MEKQLVSHKDFNKITITYIDIDADDAYHRLFFDKVPVLLKNNQPVCVSFFNAPLFEKSLIA
ncbi:MAG: hypothetical protein KGN31_05355 [Betaproteobacteria bacterium]|nr:hypothetical protein [Betaproteobacteria bacterium]MDE2423622.1 hypothetical protein [Betaproteobacteria bacterium]